ncbi:Uncharacterised protein [uncultured archaeon]|nr:Uncharacterised protein [uncultured archaeon]
MPRKKTDDAKETEEKTSPPAQEAKEPVKERAAAKSGAGNSNVLAALSYLAMPLVGIIVYIVSEKDKYARFHAIQSILVGAAALIIYIPMIFVSMVLMFIPVVGWLIALIIWLVIGLGGIGLWILLLYKAFTGEKYKLPVLGDYAEKYAG